MIVGDKRKFLTAIVCFDREAFLDELDSLGIAGRPSYEELAQESKIYQVLEAEVAAVNHELASFESIKGFMVAPAEFSVDNGHLTPSLKVKKKVILKCYTHEVDALYNKLEG